MSKQMMFYADARHKMLEGMRKVSDAVGSTLGVRGHLAVIESAYGGTPIITKDGVSVAKSIILKDKFENLGADLIKDIAIKSNEVGDGTTTSTILGYALTKEGVDAIDNGASAVDVCKGIDVAISQTVDYIRSKAKPIKGIEDIRSVALVSSNNDTLISDLITEAFEKTGKDGLISVSESPTGDTFLSFKEGMNFDRGYISPYFVNNEKLECELKDCYVLVTDEVISSARQIVNILNEVAKTGKPLVIICDDVQGEVLPILVVNNTKGSIRVNAVKAPSFGDNRNAILHDIATVTGAEFISSKFGLKLSEANIDCLGSADRIISTKNDTLIIGGHGDGERIGKRIADIQTELESEKGESNRTKLKDRLAKLCGGVCVLNVSAQTEVQMKELKDRIEDTLSSVRASIKEGIVLGGGMTLLKASYEIAPLANMSRDECMGFNIVQNALKYPFKVLCENSNMDYDCFWNEEGINWCDDGGYDMRSRQWEDNLIEEVVDPALVEISAIKNAGSIVSLVLNSSVAIVEEPEDCENKE